MSTRTNSATTAASTEQTRDVILAVLIAHGWSALDSTAIACKQFETAVGRKEALAYLRASRDEYTAFVLSGDYWSEGRNVLEAGSVLIPRGASEGKVRELAIKFASGVTATVAATYAARLLGILDKA